MPTDIALLVNPTAGRGRAARWVAPVAARLRAGGRQVVELVGGSAEEAVELASQAVADGWSTVVALGGDGLVHAAVQAVATRPVTLGIVPVGTGNDVARGLGVPRGDPRTAVDLILAGHTAHFDAGRVGEKWFASVLASGFDSQVNERANAMRGQVGRARYTLAMGAELRRLCATPYAITIDGRRLDLDAVLVAVANTTSYGAGMRIAPTADPRDGLLDVTIVTAVSRTELVRVFPRVYSGSFVSHRAVQRHRGRVVQLEARGVVAYADGERLGPLPLTVAVVPSALRVAVRGSGAP